MAAADHSGGRLLQTPRPRARPAPRRRPQGESNERLARECLDHYNALHPGDEHDLAPGDVTLSIAPCNSTTWTHGNFVARRRRRRPVGDPAPPERQTCHRGLHVKHPWLKKKVVGEFPCGHLEAESVCKMCFSYSDVVHPSPGKFARGPKPNPTIMKRFYFPETKGLRFSDRSRRDPPDKA
uniref:Uncharacterized protein n=1 Tax=Oryza punctata TaxID=4537 RepID=A0A0E0L4T6_ORYPU